MRYELWLSLRYLLARRRERFVSLIGLLSVGGVALGVMVLLVVLAVMSGFDHDLQDKLVGTNAHLSVLSEQDLSENVEPLLRTIAATAHVVGASPFLMGQAILRRPDQAFGVAVRGLDVQRETRVSQLQAYLILGHLPQRDDEVIVGVELARAIGAGVGKPLQLISPADGSRHDLVVSGVFRSGMYEYDAGLLGVTIPRAQALFGRPKMVTGIAVRVDDLERAGEVQQALAARLGPPYIVKTWMELNPALFGALRMEKIVMFIIVTLIVAVAALNIVSMLILIVTEKTKDIGILRSLGATRWSVASLFLYQGCLVGVGGTSVGVAAGLLLTTNLNALANWLERTFGIAVFPSNIYYLDHIPTQINRGDLCLVVGAALVLALLAGGYPAMRAARLAPVDALRYE